MGNHIATLITQYETARIRSRLEEVNTDVVLSYVQDHANFTLQQAYFKCKNKCFDGRGKQEETGNCVENCSVRALNAQKQFKNDIAKFHEKLIKSLMDCNDEYEAAKLHNLGPEAKKILGSCIHQSVEDNFNELPHMFGRLKASLSIDDETK